MELGSICGNRDLDAQGNAMESCLKLTNSHRSLLNPAFYSNLRKDIAMLHAPTISLMKIADNSGESLGV